LASEALKREVAEIVLIRPPSEIAELGITVMHGPLKGS
jgi:hypothetical protein